MEELFFFCMMTVNLQNRLRNYFFSVFSLHDKLEVVDVAERLFLGG